MFERRLHFHLDWAMIIALMALCVLGLVNIYSATGGPTRIYITQIYGILMARREEVEMQSWLARVLDADRHTVLLVTHDVEEALYLSDRVLVLSMRPASVAERIEISDPRAADRAAAVTSREFTELRERALRGLAEASR